MDDLSRYAMDETDREILRTLQSDARISYRDLGAQVALSANAAAERVRRLQRTGIIAGFTTVLDPAVNGRRLSALVDVRLRSPDVAERFEEAIGAMPAVIDAAHLTGRFDYQLRVLCADPGEVDRLLRRLKRELGVVETDTRIVLRSILRRAI